MPLGTIAMAQTPQRLPDPLSSPRPRGRAFLLVGGGIGLAAVLLLVVANLDRSKGSQGGERRIQAPKDVVSPGKLNPDEARGGRAFGEGSMVELEEGAWVQVTDDAGRLSQQYSAQRVEPLPDRLMQLERPRAVFFQRDGRVITLHADQGKARIPKRALETGTLTGNVRIRVYRPQDGKPADLTGPAVLEVDAADATFDNILGEIRCDGDITLRSDAGAFQGQGLSLLVDPKTNVLERLVVDRCTKPIEIRRGGDDGSRRTPPASAATGADSAPPPPPPANQGGGTGAGQQAADERFYRLTLEDSVHVTRTKGKDVAHLRGDRLVAVFSLEGRSTLIAEGDASPAAQPLAAAPLAAIAAASFGQAAAESGELVTITYTGRLILEPAGPEERLSSRDDVAVALLADNGTSDRPDSAVTIDDESTKAHVRCARASFRGHDDRVEAVGRPGLPLRVESPRLQATGERFWLERGSGKGGFSGPGTVELASGGEAFRAMAIDPATTVVSRDASGAVLLAALAADRTPATVTIGWTERLDLGFAPAAEADGELRSADFVGGVQATGQDFMVTAHGVTATFDSAGGKQSLARLVARGDAQQLAVAQRTDGKGSLDAQQLDLALRTSSTGETAPARLDATGTVAARDPRQSLFTESLVVAFAEPGGAPSEASKAEQGSQDLAVDIATVDSSGGVQALLRAEGEAATRVYADDLHGDGLLRTLHLGGKDIWVVRGTVLADSIQSIDFDEASRTARSSGPGRVRAFAQPLVDGSDRPAERPTVPERYRFQGEWNDGFLFDEKATSELATGGTITISGAVRLRSTPDRASTDLLNASTVKLELAGEQAAKDASVASAPSGLGPDAMGERGIRGVRAAGGAVLISSRWADESRKGDPRLFKLSGEEISYDTVTGEGNVPVAGTLYTHVPERTSDAGPEAKAKVAGEAPESDAASIGGPKLSLGAEGSSSFAWKQSLTMLRTEGAANRFTITMTGDVTLAHAGSRAEDELRVSGARFEARIERLAADGAKGQEDGDLAGTARILGLEASGDDTQRVVLRTSEASGITIVCDGLSYSVESGVATLTARPGRMVDVVQATRPQPIQAERVTWDMASGRITIENARGSATR